VPRYEKPMATVGRTEPYALPRHELLTVSARRTGLGTVRLIDAPILDGVDAGGMVGVFETILRSVITR